MLVDAPQLLYSLDALLGKGKGKATTSVCVRTAPLTPALRADPADPRTPSHFFSQLWLRVSPNGDRIFWLGRSALPEAGARSCCFERGLRHSKRWADVPRPLQAPARAPVPVSCCSTRMP